MAIKFGFAQSVRAEKWAPIHITLTGGDVPVSGVVTIEFDSRRGGLMHVAAPFAVAPNMTTPVEFALPLGSRLSKLNIRIEDERGRPLWLINIDDWSDVGFDRMPNILDSNAVLVGAIGPPSLQAASREWIRVREQEALSSAEGSTPDEEAEAIVAPAPTVVMSRTILANLSVLDLSTSQTPYDTLGALVLSGGSLQQINRSAVEAIREWVSSGGRLLLVLNQPGPGYERFLPQGRVVAAQTPTVQDSLRVARTLSVDDMAIAAGWHLSTVAGAPMADGPVGLGWVAVIGADPAPDIADQEVVASAWDAALDPIIGDLVQRANASSDNDQPWWRGANAMQSTLLDALAADLHNVRSVGFWPILAILAVLALLLGPVDYVILKRTGALHRSWMTALGWIGAFTALAIVAPSLLRSSETQLRRIRAVDIAQQEGVAYSSGVLGVFSGESGGLVLDEVDPDSRWRPTQVSGAQSLGSAIVLTRTPQGGATPRVLPLRRWSFLTLVDESPATSNVHAVVVQDAQTGLTVHLNGVQGAIRNAVVFTQDGWREIEFTQDGGGGFRGTVGDILQSQPEAWAPQWLNFRTSSADYMPALTTGLPGVDGRGDLMMRRVRRGGAALVCLDIENARLDVRIRDIENQSQRTVYRILTPLNAGAVNAQQEDAT